MRICFFGDSIVNGTGDPQCLGWTGRVCVSAHALGQDITYYNLGVRRDTSTDICKRWQEEATRRLPLVGAGTENIDGRLVFSFGINDTVMADGAQRVSLETSLDNFQNILTQAKTLFPTLMIGPCMGTDGAHNNRIQQLSDRYKALAEKIGVPYFDVCRKVGVHPVWIQEVTENDGYHPRAGGYTILATAVTGWDAWLAWFP